MSEQLKPSHERSTEKLDLSAEVEKSLKRAEKEAQESGGEQLDAGNLKNKVEQQAVSGKEVTVGEKEAAATQEFGVYTTMKSQTYTRTLGRIRSRLSMPDKALSKVMHNKIIEPLSEGLGKTAARPSGLLGGGIVALLGSTVLLYMAKHYGFRYNFFVFFILLAGGFIMGILAELLIRSVARLRR